MDLSIGVIGTGEIGTDHVRRLTGHVAGARVQAVFDVDAERAAKLAAEVGAMAHTSAYDLIDDPAVEAVLIAAPSSVHAELTVACIASRKPVLCEKPLAPTAPECLRVMEAELATGTRLVQVGFMRRYDEGYGHLRRAIDGGSVGDVLLAHCVHRNAQSPPLFKSEMLLTDSVIHEIDSARWLLSEELVAATVFVPRKSPLAAGDLSDPQLVLLEATSGAMVTVEIFVNCQYGYDVRCELVGSMGAASLELPSTGAVTTRGIRGQAVPSDWKGRFAQAYRDELQHWVHGSRGGHLSGPSSFDGYAATAVAEACVRSLTTGKRAAVDLSSRPGLYDGP
ncbi:MAG TPA: Gfo/Idh/MocA family oxidoreductase [Acidimicrobiales bacterium]|nr:Gfo/Idh/MocA family oxidoreductase [Acidimicrobiales bacterium]